MSSGAIIRGGRSGSGHAVHLQFADLRATVAESLPYRAGRLVAGYWLFVVLVGLALVFSVHFVGEGREAPIRDIYEVYASPAAGLLALAILAGLLLSLMALTGIAFWALRVGS